MKALAFALATAIAALGGCATMTDAMDRSLDVGTLHQQKSTFDGSTTITMSPAYLYDPAQRWGVQGHLGAIWMSAHPDTVALEIEYKSRVDEPAAYRSITGLDVNLAGKIYSFEALAPTRLESSGYDQVARTVYASSDNVVVIPVALLEAMARSSDCRLRIRTSAGAEDALFSSERIPGGEAAALHYIRPFIAKVDAFRLANGP